MLADAIAQCGLVYSPLHRPLTESPPPPRAAPVAACCVTVTPLLPSLPQAHWRGALSAPSPSPSPVICSVCVTLPSPSPDCRSLLTFLLALTLRPPHLPQHLVTPCHPLSSSYATGIPSVLVPLVPLPSPKLPSLYSPPLSSPSSSPLSLLSVD